LTSKKFDGINVGINGKENLKREFDTVMPLTKTLLRNASAGQKAYKLYDFDGLYVLVNKNGSKYFRFDYRFDNIRKTLAIGVFPDMSLDEARERLREAKKLLAQHIDPCEQKKQVRQAQIDSLVTFGQVAREWIAKYSISWRQSYHDTIMSRMNANILPYFENRPINDITGRELLSLIRLIEDRGAYETSHRVLSICDMVFRFGFATDKCDRNPAADLRGALVPVKTQHRAALVKPGDVARLLLSIEAYSGSFVVKSALRLAPLVFVRPGELRHAEWSEIDLETEEWRIPAEKMKMARNHIVPLAPQAVAILKGLYPLTGRGKYVFPNPRTGERPMSENALLAALRCMGFQKHEMTAHGFRSTASTLLHEQGWPSEIIELQLAHVDTNKVRSAYNQATHLSKRREMMIAWADYLDSLKENQPQFAVESG